MIERWGDETITLLFEDGVRLAGINRPSRAALPLVEIELAGHGRAGTAGGRHVDGQVSRRLRPVGHDKGDGTLSVRMRDPETGLRVVAHYELRGQVLRSWTELTAEQEVTVEHVSSFVCSGVATTLGVRVWERELELWTAHNPWSGEYRWSGSFLAELGLYDVGMVRFGQTGTKNRLSRTGTGSWPTSEHLPMGILRGRDGCLAWQIEHNGSWHFEIGDRFGDLYLSLAGPSQREHQWSKRLLPGESFTTVPVALTLSDDPMGALTRYRRAVRRPHADNVELPVVFNDFMNCLMGDPTTGRLLPLVKAAARAGAEYFCIDAGWFDDEIDAEPGPGGVPAWWDAVGTWQPSTTRFPRGLVEVTDAIRAAGMTPGLWLEPEVVGVRSRLDLPEEAFFRSDGVRLVEWGRHHLNLAHPAAVRHLDATVDRLIGEFGLGYLKLDYNIAVTPGSGLLEHNRAYLDWLERLQGRYPGLVLEACASGGMRADHATLARVPVQSLTDQQDETLIPAIAAAAPTVVPPEQGAVWAYPQPDFDDERIIFTMVSAMLGRIHLSGRLDLLSDHQLDLVTGAIDVYRTYRRALARGIPRWPLGLPGWRDGWLALAVDCGPETFLAVWRRDDADPTCELPLSAASVSLLYPADAMPCWTSTGPLRITLPEAYTARLLRLTGQ
ncbi:alpha-galactosidase [Actinoallomurus sp. NPDC050550]|uniref:alpha-galactosidase n=1 Tax=Actinoallomurus sp. NPDC050550 TaxID=3154937 RepID=UPI0033C1CDA6